MSPSIKLALRKWYYSICYRRCRIGTGCYIRGDSTLGTGCSLGDSCSLSGAQLVGRSQCSAGCVLGPGAMVFGSRLGPEVVIEWNSKIHNSDLEGSSCVQREAELSSVCMGAHSYVARNSILNDVRIGRFCSIGPRCLIGTGDHPTDLVSTSPMFYSTRKQTGSTLAVADDFEERKTVEIGSDVWLGAGVFVRDGISIGHGAIVGAGAVVTRDVQPYSIVGGVPARVIRFRCSSEISDAMLRIAWWDWPLQRLKDAQSMLAKNDFASFVEWVEEGAPKS